MNKYDFGTDTIIYKDHKIENFFKDFSQQPHIKDYVKDNIIMLCVGGSHAYGIDTEASDLDIRGIFKDNINQILGFEKIESLENITNDSVIYSLTKALHLIIEQNPNIHELLWVDEEEILYATDDYWYLRSKREKLLSKLAKHKYSGYAVSQFKRIKGHNKWLNKEREGKFNTKPNIKDYILFIEKSNGIVHKFTDFTFKSQQYYFMKVKNEIYNMFWSSGYSKFPLVEEGNSFIPIREEKYSITDAYCGIIWFNKSQFQIDLDEYNKWRKWKEDRNETRHELEEKYGYDTKHATHTFRLLNMGLEILRDKEVKVKRPDKDFLLDIRNGKYTYEWIMEEAERIDKELMQKAYEESTLPNSVDKKIYLEIIKTILKV